MAYNQAESHEFDNETFMNNIRKYRVICDKKSKDLKFQLNRTMHGKK